VLAAGCTKAGPVQADLSFGVVTRRSIRCGPTKAANIVSRFTEAVRRSGVADFVRVLFLWRGGNKSPLLAELDKGAIPSAHGAGEARFGPGGAQGAQSLPDTAYWNPNVRTGADGHARVEFNFSDALTTWRTTIRAMTDDGKAGGAVTARAGAQEPESCGWPRRASSARATRPCCA